MTPVPPGIRGGGVGGEGYIGYQVTGMMEGFFGVGKYWQVFFRIA